MIIGNDDEAVRAVENIFFAHADTPAGLAACIGLLESGRLAPRPAAVLLARIWHSGRLDSPRWTVPHLRRARDDAGDVLMDGRGYALYEALPDTITIFRGSRDRDGDRNMSWTLDRAVARIFAGSGGGPDQGCVLAADIGKTNVLAVFNLIGEQEAVVDPDSLRNLRVIENHVPRDGRDPMSAMADQSR